MDAIKEDPDYPDKLVVVLRQDGKGEDDVDPEKDTRAEFVWFSCYYMELMDGYFELLSHGSGEHGNLYIEDGGLFAFGEGFRKKYKDLAPTYLYMTIHGIEWEAHCCDEFRVQAPTWGDERE